MRLVGNHNKTRSVIASQDRLKTAQQKRDFESGFLSSTLVILYPRESVLLFT